MPRRPQAISPGAARKAGEFLAAEPERFAGVLQRAPAGVDMRAGRLAVDDEAASWAIEVSWRTRGHWSLTTGLIAGLAMWYALGLWLLLRVLLLPVLALLCLVLLIAPSILLVVIISWRVSGRNSVYLTPDRRLRLPQEVSVLGFYVAQIIEKELERRGIRGIHVRQAASGLRIPWLKEIMVTGQAGAVEVHLPSDEYGQWLGELLSAWAGVPIAS